MLADYKNVYGEYALLSEALTSLRACSRSGAAKAEPRTSSCQSEPAFVAGQLIGRCHLGARDLGDETGDKALDLGRRQVVAGDGVRLAEIAANHECA